MAAHRYWRVIADSHNGDPVACSELEFRDAIGGPQLCVGGTPIANGYYGGGYETWRAFDGLRTDGNEWASNISDGAWIGYDFGAGQEKDIIEIAYTARQGYGTQTPKTGRLQWSDDGAAWTDAFTIFFGGFANGETKVRQAPTPPPEGGNPHLWWRIKHDTSTGYNSAREIEMRGTPGGADLTDLYFANAADGGHYADWDAYRAFDNNLGTNYAAGNGGWVAAKFNGPTTIEEFAWTIRNDGGDDYQVPRSGTVDYSDDGANWTTAWTWELPGSWPSGTARVATNPDAGGAVVARRRQAIIVT